MRGFAILLCAALTGFAFGLIAASIVGVYHIFQLPALNLALSRAIFVAKHVFGFFQSIGAGGFQTLILSIGVGIFLNNCIVVAIILFSPILIFKAKPFSDKHLGRLYQRYGLWLFKPIGWRAYRILAAILPLYALALQFYLIGGTILSLGRQLPRLSFLALEILAVAAACLIAIQPSMSSQPLEELPRYIRKIKVGMPAIIAVLYLAALLEAYQLLSAIL
ncbi:MAG: hypothetical protein DRN59_01505 [Thaumarchaeota archaeon]|nr:MAG: hypothetical protein DRN59_01505 [Nitrososphaerota archaeon]